MEKLSASNCPVNDNHKNLPKAMHTTHAEYCRLRGVAAAVPAIVFVVQQGETNAVDQRFLEFELWDGYKVKGRSLHAALIVDPSACSCSQASTQLG